MSSLQALRSAPYAAGPTTGRFDKLMLGAGVTAAAPGFVIASAFAGLGLAVGYAIGVAEGLRDHR